jgi:hypothetical protein
MHGSTHEGSGEPYMFRESEKGTISNEMDIVTTTEMQRQMLWAWRGPERGYIANKGRTLEVIRKGNKRSTEKLPYTGS